MVTCVNYARRYYYGDGSLWPAWPAEADSFRRRTSDESGGRDHHFGSSIAPLLLEGYEEITLVDLRYITAAYLPQLIEMEAYEDVLFLYSENVLRNSGSLKF